MKLSRLLLVVLFCLPLTSMAQTEVIGGWQMQDAAKVSASAAQVSDPRFQPAGWYRATVPGTVLTTLVDNHVFPEPLYGENMRAIPESLNRTTYWYRTTLQIPASHKGRRTWLRFGGINYAAQVWLNGRRIGDMTGAFKRGEFDITESVRPGKPAGLAVLIAPQPHPGTPHEHTVENGTGHNGGQTALDGPTFLSTIGWDWLMAVRDRATGLWQPVTLASSGPLTIAAPQVVSTLTQNLNAADLVVNATVVNHSTHAVTGTLVGTLTGEPTPVEFRKTIRLAAGEQQTVHLSTADTPALHLTHPKLWWPNGYGEPSLHHLALHVDTGSGPSDQVDVQFGIRKVDYEVPGSDVLTLVVNNTKVMVRGGNWGLDEAMKRIPRERLEAQVRMHALANLNLIRNWVGQSTSPDLYDLADRYGLMIWDEFFQPNPGDGPNVADTDTYLANVTDKVLYFRNHPSIVVWCARNEGHPPPVLDQALAAMMKRLDPTRLYQSSSTDGRGVSSHGPYYWRAPQFFYQINEAFKTETGSVSVPTLESIQGMMPQIDWETVNDDWAQHDMAAGAQRGNEYPYTLAKRYGPIRNLADFTRKAQLANYESFRGMYESRNATMFQNTTGIITWMSHPAQPSFVWQLYHYDLEPNASLFAVRKAGEAIHVQLNEALRTLQVVNNTPRDLSGLTLTQSVYRLNGSSYKPATFRVNTIPASSTGTVSTLWVDPHISEIYFVKLDLRDATNKVLSTNLYWKNVAQDDYRSLDTLPVTALDVSATAHSEGDRTSLTVHLANTTDTVALLAHLQLHRKSDGARVLPVFYSDNYISLVPGESRDITVEAKTSNLAGGPVLLLDGFNVALHNPAIAGTSSGGVAIGLNENAQPSHWPASQLVPLDGKPVPEKPARPLSANAPAL